MKKLFIVNPKSGSVRKNNCLRLLRDRVLHHGDTLVYTTQPCDATRIAREAVGSYSCVVAVGGDGTVNEIAQGLLGGATPLGILPAGSGNGFARSLGIPLSPQQGLAVLEHGKIQHVDVGVANGNPFLCAAGCGMDATIVHRFNKLHQRGLIGYLYAASRYWFQRTPQHYEVRNAHGIAYRGWALGITVANAPQYGNNARIAPRARLEDGKLNLVVIPCLRTRQLPATALRLFCGTLPFECDASTEYFVRMDTDIFHTDGETHAPVPEIHFLVRPQQLAVYTP